MNYSDLLRQLTGDAAAPCDLSTEEAESVFAAMLDGGVPELELGALLSLLHIKGESVAELLGFGRALADRVARIEPVSDSVLPVVLPSYGGSTDEPDLLPLLALLLQRFHIPVLIHGSLDRGGHASAAYVLRELGIMPSVNADQAQRQLATRGIAFVPSGALSPGLAALMSLHARLGACNVAHLMAKLLTPFPEGSVRVIGATHSAHFKRLQQYFVAAGEVALLLEGARGEPLANPHRRPRLELYDGGMCTVLFEAENDSGRPLRALGSGPRSSEPAVTAAWIRAALAGRVPLPMPLINQLACCLFATGYTSDMNQAKALVAVEAGSLAAA
ncbi:MAG: DNA-binding protein YbiB [Proteobacteria bacterium]|nr:DNA-binding protein YbiB [Burkholderiales bacterium]